MRRLIALIGFLLIPSLAFAQSAILQGGPWTAGHVPMFVGQGSSQAITQDSGPASGGGPGIGLSELLITARGTGTPPYSAQGTGPFGTTSCQYDAPTTNPTGYHYLCWSPNATGGNGLVAFGAAGGAATTSFNFNVNGTTYQFPFSISGVVGPSTSVVNDAACWNNTTGTLLKDCGAFVTVGGNNTWTGTNNYTGTFQINTVTQTFPGSGNLVGTSDSQTLTNKSINAAEVNTGTLPCGQFPGLTGNVTSSGCAATIAAGVVTNANLAAAGSANTIKGAATSTTVTDLAVPSCSGATSALQWVTGTGLQCASIAASTAGWGLTLAAGVFSISTTQPPYSFDFPINLGLTSSVGSSSLTINVTGANGSAPSSSNPVSVPFRSTTLTTGTPVWTAITAAQSIVIPSGATLGTSNSTPFRIWLFEEYNGGAPELAAATCSTATQSYGCTAWEATRITTTTITGLATAAGTPYSTTGVSNDAVRIIGYCDYASGLATAGAYVSNCTTLQVLSPGMKKPGDVVQYVEASSGTSATAGATYTPSNTFPTAANGALAVAAPSFTPLATENILRITAIVTGGSGTGNETFVGYIGNGSATVVAAASGLGTNTSVASVPIFYSLLAPSSGGAPTATTYSAYFIGTGGTVTSNAINGTTSSLWGGSGISRIRIEEIVGSLNAPANDNINPGVYSLTG